MLGGAARGLAEQVDLRWGAPTVLAGTGDDPHLEPPPFLRRSGARGWLSLDEKAALTGGADIWHTVAIDRLGIPALRMTDGPAGVRGTRFAGDPSVCLPCGTALGATWDRDLVQRVGRFLGDQARGKDAHVLLAPTVNLHRHPLAGRNFESFSEDPYLTAQLACGFVRGVQERGVGCAVKHFVANEQEHDRLKVSVEVDERTLREVYLRPFEAVVRSAGVWAVMAAYNRLHGVRCSEHPGLLQDVLRDDWGFDGLVMSDWFGTYSTAAVASGLDLEMPGPPRFLGHYAAAAVRQGDVPASALDRSSRAMLTLVDRVVAPGPEDRPGPTAGGGPTAVAGPIERTDAAADDPAADDPGTDDPGTEAGAPDAAPGDDPADLARHVAREAIVLLRNDGLLPLDAARSGTIAVLGPKADRPDIQGRGSAHVQPSYVVTPLDGIARRAQRDAVAGAGPTVLHELGVAQRAAAPFGDGEIRAPDGQPGLLVEYFAGPTIAGEPFHAEVLPDTRLFWLGSPVPGLLAPQTETDAHAADADADADPGTGAPATDAGTGPGPSPGPGGSSDEFSVRATAHLTVDRPGPWQFALCSAGRSRVLLDGAVLIDNLRPERGTTFYGRGSVEVAAEAELMTGVEHRLVAELHARAQGGSGISGLTLTAQAPPDPDALLRAVGAAQAADVAVVVVGGRIADSEGSDRPGLDLPEDQVALVRAVAAANPATVVVVDTAGPVTMDWADDVAAVVQLWYAGQEAGAALADVLFGDADPGGRLPTSFPRRIEDTPAFPHYPGREGRVRYGEGVFVGHRHYDSRDVEPGFCFGHGLSYTRFAYGPLQVDTLPGRGRGSDPVDGPTLVRVHVDVTNVGHRPGSEVVQVYVSDLAASVPRPQQELAQFRKLRLAPGETRTVHLDLPRRAFAFWDVTHHTWVVEPGEFEVRVGSSSRQVHGRATVHLP